MEHSAPEIPDPEPEVPLEPAIEMIEIAVLDHEANAAQHFPDNSIKTSKYNLITFLPLNLFEQFRRLSNFYFLLVAIVGLIPNASPFNPFSNVAPLVFVLLVAGGKAAYEDFRRHQSDSRANSIEAHVLRDGAVIAVPSHAVRTGDVMFIESGDEIRADAVLLASSDEDGVAYIETANLDGETSAKPRRACVTTKGSLTTKEAVFAAAERRMTVLADLPSVDLVTWKGVVITEGGEQGVDMTQFLPRGAVLRNTQWAFAAVVYTGIHTKLFLNLRQMPSKFSHLDATLNKFIIGLFVINQVLVVGLAGLAVIWSYQYDPAQWYLQAVVPDRVRWYSFFVQYLTYFVLMSYMVPISLFVTMEVVKAMQAGVMAVDQGMAHWDTHREEWRFCRPKTSDLNDQLAHVRYVFSDKTGTLTENKMNTRHIFSRGVLHNEGDSPGGLMPLMTRTLQAANAPPLLLQDPGHRMLLAMALCHNVMCFPSTTDPTGRIYEGQSPDEVALVRTARNNGYVLTGRTAHTMTLMLCGAVELRFEIVAELDFDPTRKMMSILLKDALGRHLLLSKGADSSMLDRQDSRDVENRKLLPQLDAQLTQMAGEGLRTLVFGMRVLSPEEAAEWLAVYAKASVSMLDRDSALAAAYSAVENQLQLLGATGVEDKLQEAVPETVRFLLRAGVVVWMLTGDKRETAVTIAATSGIVDPQVHRLHHVDVSRFLNEMTDTNEAEVRERMWAECRAGLDDGLRLAVAHPGEVVLVIDGVTLQCVLENDSALFAEFGLHCASAVGCRLTPLQKAECVRLFQQHTSYTALAIGDGANDVSMIQAARVGIGIMGVEGSQAELAADYAIPRFKHLWRLIAVHGRYSWYRNTTTILYCFYKNVGLSICLGLYCAFSGFSGITMMDSWLLSLFNSGFTAVMPFVIGISDRDADPDVLEATPELYAPIQREQRYFNARAIAGWALSMVLHSQWCFWTVFAAMEANDMTVQGGTLMHYGTAVFIIYVLVVDFQGAIAIRRWEPVQGFGMFLSLAAIPVFVLGYSGIPSVFASNAMYRIAFDLIHTAYFYTTWVDLFALVAVSLALWYLFFLQRADEVPDKSDGSAEGERFDCIG